jgi:hypothetical protein
MRGDATEDPFLAICFPDEFDPTLRKVTQSAVEHAARSAAGAEGEVVLIDQRDAEPSHGGVARDAGADDSSPGNQQIEGVVGKAVERFVPK